MKCQPQNKLLASQGQILHDSHAEVLAIRAFNRSILEECQRLAANPELKSDMLERTFSTEYGQPFRIKPDIRLFMYCSEAPCGDCSMELIMASQQDATPWPSKEYLTRTAAKAHTATDVGGYDASQMQGRGHFDQLGVVRRKPARADAPISLSKSCSDKLAMKQCISLLSGLVALFVEPHNAYLDTLVLPSCQRHIEACQRAFGPQGRLGSMSGLGDSAYRYTPFSVAATTLEFEYGRRSEAALAAGPLTACNASMIFTGRVEKITNGVLSGRRSEDLRAVSTVSRRGMCKLAGDVAELLGSSLCQALAGRYADIKLHARLEDRREQKQRVRDTLVSWQPNTGDDQWDLQVTE